MGFIDAMKGAAAVAAVRTAPARKYVGSLTAAELAYQRSLGGVLESFFTPASVRTSRTAGRVASTVVLDAITAVAGTRTKRTTRKPRVVKTVKTTKRRVA